MASSKTYSSLLPALVDVLETSQKLDGQASKQALLTSTNEFKEILTKAKQSAASLPGGDMSLLDQDHVIEILEKLRDYKRSQLRLFSRLTAKDIRQETRESLETQKIQYMAADTDT